MGNEEVEWERRQLHGLPPVVYFDLLTQVLGALPEIHASETVDTCHVDAVMHLIDLTPGIRRGGMRVRSGRCTPSPACLR